jgi:hypothetical protein
LAFGRLATYQSSSDRRLYLIDGTGLTIVRSRSGHELTWLPTSLLKPARHVADWSTASQSVEVGDQCREPFLTKERDPFLFLAFQDSGALVKQFLPPIAPSHPIRSGIGRIPFACDVAEGGETLHGLCGGLFGDPEAAPEIGDRDGVWPDRLQGESMRRSRLRKTARRQLGVQIVDDSAERTHQDEYQIVAANIVRHDC